MYKIENQENNREGIIYKDGIKTRVGYLFENIKGVYMAIDLHDGLKNIKRTYLKSGNYLDAKKELLEILNNDPTRI